MEHGLRGKTDFAQFTIKYKLIRIRSNLRHQWHPW